MRISGCFIRRRFTLIELLTVITVISILMSLLLPALAQAKEKVRAISCLGNFRQMGLAVLAYPDDYNDFMPPADFQGDIDSWINWKRENELDPLALRPHPYEFELYYDS